MASSHTAAQVGDGCTGQLTGRGTLGAGQLTALILGQNSGGHSQVLLGLLASLNQPRRPLCRLWTLQREGGAAAVTSRGVSASRPNHSNKSTVPESHNPWEPRRAVEKTALSPPGHTAQLYFTQN